METRYGYTTGTYAAAAAKAALSVLLNGRDLAEVELTLPRGEKASIPVCSIDKRNDSVRCGVVKKSVEEADVTHNMEIYAEVSLREDDRIVIDGGTGIGRVTRRGLQLPVGEAAINPVPRRMIRSSLRELTSKGVNVTISAPKGEEIAARTTNSRLGITGGISIIGTTGIMRPKSLASFKRTIVQRLEFCRENGMQEIVITPGNIGEEAVLTHFGSKVDRDRIVQSGDHLGFTLKKAFDMKLSFVLAGHPGKLAKVLAGHFQTHYTKAPPANGAVAAFLEGKVEERVMMELKESPTVEGMTAIIMRHGRNDLLDELAKKIEEKVRDYLKTGKSIPTLLFNMEKNLIGSSRAGTKWVKG